MLQRFIDENLWDEALVFTGDMLFEEGVKAPVITSYGSLSTPAIQGLKERIRRLGNRR